MALAVVTVGSGGVPVIDVSADAALAKYGQPVTEAANGLRVTKVTAPAWGIAITYIASTIASP